MIEGIKPYPAYKDSGVPWLGDVPEDWGISAFRAVARARKGRQPASLMGHGGGDTGGVPYLSMEFLRSPGNSPSEFAAPQDDLVIADYDDTVLLWDGANAGEFLKAKSGAVSSTSALIVPHSGHRRFFFHACKLAEPTLRALTVGMGIPHVDGDVLKGIRFPAPPLPEQAAIVRFLDHADRRIRGSLTAKRKLIALLNEQKQAIIHHAVTRGLDPNVRLKASGVESLGDVPEHWQVRRIASFSPKITNGWVGPTRDILQDNGVPYIQSLHVKQGRIRFEKKYFVAADWLTARSKICLRRGDVVVVQTGDIGQVACVPPEFDGAGCHALIIIRTDPLVISGQFLDLALRSRYGFDSLKSVQTGALHPHLNCTWVREIFVPIPGVSEQQAIVGRVAEETGALDSMISIVEREDFFLREYRARLISDIVTGKLDVRDAAARLPEDVEELAPPDDLDALAEGDQSDDEGDVDAAFVEDEN